MTVSSTANRVVYNGNAATTNFPFAFKVQSPADLVVIYTDTTGTDFTLSPAQYGTAGFGLDAGGTVTYPVSGAPIAIGTKLTIYRNVSVTQPAVISNQGAMWPSVIESALDRATYILQRVADSVSRALMISPTDSGTLNPLPNATQRANSVLGFDGTGQPYAAQLVAGLGSASAWLVANFFPMASAAAARGALGAAGLTDNNAYIGDNTHGGTEDFAQSPTVPTPTAGDNSGKAANMVALFASTRRPFNRNQTVTIGPITATGLPNFWPVSAVGLTINFQNISSAAPLIIVAADGFGAYGEQVRIGIVTVNHVVLLPNNTSGYVYADIDAAAAVTYGTMTLVPIVQQAGVFSTTNSQFTFNIAERVAKVGNGTTADVVRRVILGEFVTAAGNISSLTPYAYNGYFESAFTNTLPASGSITNVNHNLGVMPNLVEIVIENITAELGYSPGDRMSSLSGLHTGTTFSTPLNVRRNKKLVTVAPINSGANAWLSYSVATVGGPVALSVANWKWNVRVDRGW
jgi:hypothetical protein